jgi:hypothetical protein
MDTTTIEKIPLVLKLDADSKTVLEAAIENQTFDINFETEDQSNLRDFFSALLKAEEKKHFLFEARIDAAIKNETLKKVANEYTESLNNELSKILAEMEMAISQKDS